MDNSSDEPTVDSWHRDAKRLLAGETPHDPAAYGREWVDDYDEREDAAHAELATGLIDALADGGRVLEVAAGTGRVACRLRSPDVTATDASPEMLHALRRKSSTVRAYVEVLPRVSGGPYKVIAILAYSLWVMLDAEDQRKFVRNASDALEPGGYLVVETGSPDLARWRETASFPGVTRASIFDESTQRVVHRIEIGGRVRLANLRWTWDEEVERWAKAAGLEYVRREPGTDLRIWRKV